MSSAHPATDTRIFYKECSGLAEAGYDIHLVVTGTHSGTLNGVRLHGVKRRSSDGRLKRMTLTLIKVARMAWSLDAGVYHFHDPELIPIGFLFKVAGKHVIYDAHEDTPRDLLTRDYLPGRLKSLVIGMIERIENFCGKRFDAVVAATPHIHARYKTQGANAVCINNYPLIAEFDKVDHLGTSKENAFCYIGAIARERGIFEVFEALPKAGVKLLLGGMFSERDQLERAKSLPEWRHVDELGQINRDKIAEVFSRSVGGIVTFHPELSHINAQPNKLFEYMSAGLPVIASDFPAWRDIVKNNRCGILVNPLDPKAIAEAMRWLLYNPEKATAMGKRGREAVYKKYNWNNEFRKLDHLYRNLLAFPNR